MRHLTQKHWECGKDMVIVIAYFEKVYDSMRREKVWSSSQKYQNTYSKVNEVKMQ